MAPVSVTLNYLEGHSPVAGLFKCNPSNICAAYSTNCVLARFLGDSWTSCFTLEWFTMFSDYAYKLKYIDTAMHLKFLTQRVPLISTSSCNFASRSFTSCIFIPHDALSDRQRRCFTV